ncbi:hypothetical protein [Saccharopolyspora griseoalba]|uniref:Uncharacterized protein n=1 Tax=Saccharopolyspora griseoalba TaxID=1431848 RepID=A0ABW2LPP2_9PSEU
MEQDRDLAGATVYRWDAYPGARWHALPDGEVVLERPSGDLAPSTITASGLASSAAKETPTWYLETSGDSVEPEAPAGAN